MASRSAHQLARKRVLNRPWTVRNSWLKSTIDLRQKDLTLDEPSLPHLSAEKPLQISRAKYSTTAEESSIGLLRFIKEC